MGINADLLSPEFQEGPLADILLNFDCSICDELISDAMILKCQHNFCRGCIAGWIATQADESNVPCPDCRNIFDPANGMEESRMARNVLSVVNFKCKNQLCEEKVFYENYYVHPEVCLYECDKCTFCDEEVVRAHSQSHKLKCFPYVNYQKSELEVVNSSLKSENDALKNENCLLKAENSTLKTQIVDLKETGFLFRFD